MYRAMRWYSFVAIVSIVLSCSLVLAEGKAKERGNKPPGWEKWTNQEKKGWKKELWKAKEDVHKRAKKLKNFSKEDLDKALLSVEAAARKGMPIKYAQGLVEKAMEKDIKGIRQLLMESAKK